MARRKDQMAELLNEVAAELAQEHLVKAEASDEALQPKAADVDVEAQDAMPAPDAAPADPAMDPAAAQEPQISMEELQAEYAQLAPEELEMHKQALMGALAALQGAAAPDVQPAAPSMEKSGMPMEASKEESKMKKEEVKVDKKANGGAISKSESDLANLVKEQAALLKSQQGDIENLAKALDKMLDRPNAKSINSITELKKSELVPQKAEPSKEDVMELLLKKIPELSKKERDLVAKFELGLVQGDALAAILAKL